MLVRIYKHPLEVKQTLCYCMGLRGEVQHCMAIWLQRSRCLFNLHLTASSDSYLQSGTSHSVSVFHSQRQPRRSRKGHMMELFGPQASSSTVSKPHDVSSSSEEEEAGDSSDSHDETESNSDAHVRRRPRIHFEVTDLQRLYHLPLKTVRGWAGEGEERSGVLIVTNV